MATTFTLLLGVLALSTSLVHAEIRFDVSPQSTGVLLGQDLVLDCVAMETSGVPLQYDWEFNSSPSPQPLLPNNSLYIAQIARADLGEYRCGAAITGQPATRVVSTPASVVKAYIEDFAVQPVSVTAENGTEAVFECVTGLSAPQAMVSVERDGIAFTEGRLEAGAYGSPAAGDARQTSMKLVLTALTTLEGSYVCVAHNPLTGETVRSEPANLTVTVPPEAPTIVFAPPVAPIAPASQPFTLPCGVQGNPTPTVLWHIGQATLVSGERVQVWENGSLHFTELKEEDAGSYTCSAANVVGVAVSEPVVLTVAVLDLEFVRSPSDISVLGGQPLSLLCVPPRSVPPARVIWYREAAPFVPREGEFAAAVRPDGTLHFDNVQVTDEGRYFCVAVNDHAVPSTRTSQTATVTVHASPLILQPPVPKRVIKGQLLTLTCRVQGRPEPTVRWFKDNEELVPGERVTFQNSRMELVVRTTNKDDEGMYRCVVSNRLGNVSSASVLVFIVVPPEIVRPPEDASMRAGTQVTVPCLVYGDPRPTVVWFKDGRELSSSSRVNISREGVVIRSARAEDEGTYQCRAVNEGGTKDAQGVLRIELKPHLTIYPEDTFIGESKLLVLYCEATGYPAPTYRWTFNGSSTLPTDFEIQDSGRRLVVQSVSPEYTGSYECVAENVAGADSHTVSILVTVRPQITTILGAVVIDQGTDLHLTCVVEGSPRPGVTWSVDGAALRPTPDSRLSFPAYNELLIRYARGYNSGRYQCLAENDAGRDTTNIQVYVRETPLPPKLTSVQAVSMTSVNMTWEAAAQDANNQVTYWVVQSRERVSQVFKTVRQDLPPALRSYEVPNLRPFTEYVFRVAARNHIGIGTYSATLGARTLESAPSAPRNLQMVSHNATAVTLQWEVPAETNGLIRAYQIHHRHKYGADEFEVQDIDQPSKTLERHTVSDLNPYTTYEMKVRGATIELGRYLWGEFSKPVDITTSAEVPSRAPPGVTVLVLSSRSVRVSWQALPDEFHNGPLDGYIIQYRRRDVNAFTERRVGVGQRAYDVTGLLPWRHYDLRVTAYNRKGRGVPSDVTSVRTDPEVPTGQPTNVKVSVLSESAVSVSWQPIPLEERQSEISGYAVEYENIDEPGSDTLSEDVGDPSITELNITGLLPWTKYRIRVRGFTTQLSNGFGPNSQSIVVTTLEGVPGPVQNLSVEAFPTGVRLSWDPPQRPNGVIRNYVVTYSLVTSEDEDQAEGPQNIPRRRRDVGTQVSNDTWELTTSDTNVTVTGLRPESAYAFAVVGETSAGRPSTSETPSMATIVLPPPPATQPVTRAVTTPSVVMTTRGVMTQDPGEVTTSSPPGSSDTNYLPYYLGGGIGGAVLLFTILLIIIICCFKRQNKKGVYFIPPPAFTAQTLEDMQTGPTDAASSATSDRSGTHNGSATTETRMASSGSAPTWTTSAGTQSSIAVGEGLPGHSAATSAILRPRSDIHTNSSQAFPSRGIPLDPMLDLTYSSLDELRLSHLSDQRYSRGVPHIQFVPPQTGLENPAYQPDSVNDLSSAFSPNTDSTFLRSSVYTSQQDLYAQVNLSKRRKNRMKSQTAAAIAAQKNATSSMFLDTDALIKNDSVVVYDERTAL